MRVRTHREFPEEDFDGAVNGVDHYGEFAYMILLFGVVFR